MTRRVVYRPLAQADLRSIHDYIAEENPARARAFVDDIQDRCDRLPDAPLVGSLRSEILPGLRVIGFRRRAAIAFFVTDQEVLILRILYGGRDLVGALQEHEDE